MMACQNKQCLTFAKIKRADREKVCSKTNMITFKRGKNISYCSNILIQTKTSSSLKSSENGFLEIGPYYYKYFEYAFVVF